MLHNPHNFFFSNPAGCKPVLELVLEYFELFGGKATCFWDLSPYLSLLKPEQGQEVRIEIL